MPSCWHLSLLSRHSRDYLESFRTHVLALPEVTALYHLGDTNDFLLPVAVRDSNHLRELALAAFTERPEVAHLEQRWWLKHVAKACVPVYGEGE